MNGNGLDWMKNQWNDTMIQHSVYAAVVFLVVAHPETFKMVDNGLKGVGVPIANKNVQLLLHAVVFALLMYFGTTMVFDPFVSEVGKVVSGFRNKKVKKAGPKKAGPKKAN